MTVNSYTFNNEGFETSLKSSFISNILFLWFRELITSTVLVCDEVMKQYIMLTKVARKSLPLFVGFTEITSLVFDKLNLFCLVCRTSVSC